MKVEGYDSIRQAAEDKLTPSAYSYDGQLEKLNRKIELLQDMVVGLVDVAFGESAVRLSNKEKLEMLLGYNYNVED